MTWISKLTGGRTVAFRERLEDWLCRKFRPTATLIAYDLKCVIHGGYEPVEVEAPLGVKFIGVGSSLGAKGNSIRIHVTNRDNIPEDHSIRERNEKITRGIDRMMVMDLVREYRLPREFEDYG